MVFSLLLTTMLALDPSPQEGFATFQQAVEAANEGRDAEALVAFQHLVNLNPDDLDGRLWIARLHVRMGNQDLAEPVYRGVLLEDPGDLEAMLGVANALLARGEFEQAEEILNVAEETEPENDEVVYAVGRSHLYAGRTPQALEYFERAYAISPTDQHRMSLEGARLSYLHRVEIRGSGERFDAALSSSSSYRQTSFGDVTVNIRLNDQWRVFGRGQAQRKFGVSEQRGGGGAEWRWKRTTILRGHALVMPDNTVMPEGDFLGEFQYTYLDATWTGSVRHFDFTSAKTTTISPAVQWTPAATRWAFGLRYALSWSESVSRFNAFAGTRAGHSLHLQGAYRLRPRVWLQTGYAAGVEDFENYSIDRVGTFRANTLSAGVRFDFPTLTGLVGNYERQWRSGNADMSRFSLSLQQRF
jgi:tetratricopeptide (TPR) repeat protein